MTQENTRPSSHFHSWVKLSVKLGSLKATRANRAAQAWQPKRKITGSVFQSSRKETRATRTTVARMAEKLWLVPAQPEYKLTVTTLSRMAMPPPRMVGWL